MKKIGCIGALLLFIYVGYMPVALSQEPRTVNEGLEISIDIRPRVELLENYTWEPGNTTATSVHATQRNRIHFTYTSEKLKTHASLQEIHLWGKTGLPSRVGSINIYELYAEPRISEKLSLRIGRQAISLDNGRIFSAAPWAQQGRAHEGIRILYSDGFTTDLTFAFTRPYSAVFDATYSPVASNNYKFLFVHHFLWKLNDRYSLNSINALDVFAHESEQSGHYSRWTNGGRITYRPFNRSSFSINAYYQHGRNDEQKIIRAYYLQPEITSDLTNLTLKLGAELLSGSPPNQKGNVYHSFVPLYGVTWKFMGNMNFFTRFPSDVGGQGLINPYLHVIYPFNEQISLRADGMLFYLQHEPSQNTDGPPKKYLGAEVDLSMLFTPKKDIDLHLGFSFMNPSERMEYLGKMTDTEKIAYWSYFMVSYHPMLWRKNSKRTKRSTH